MRLLSWEWDVGWDVGIEAGPSSVCRRPSPRTAIRPVPSATTRPTTAASTMPSACSRVTKPAAAGAGSAISNPPEVWASKRISISAGATPSTAARASAGRFLVSLDGAGNDALGRQFPHAGQQRHVVPGNFDIHPAGRAIDFRWPIRPKPVTSVQAWASNSPISSAARRLSAAMDRAAAADAAGSARPICAAKARMPVPSGLVKTSRSPGRAAALVAIRRGSTRPVTAKPALICRPGCYGRRSRPRRPRSWCPVRRGGSLGERRRGVFRAGKPTTDSAVSGRPPIAYTSLSELAAAMRPNT